MAAVDGGIDFKGVMWKGKRIGDLSREELIEALFHYVARIEELESSKRTRAYALGMVEMVKRGEQR